MEYYLYSVQLPFSKKVFSYRELSSKEQITLAKSNIVFPYDEDGIVDYSRIIKKIIRNCVEEKTEFQNINILDYIMFAIKLRIASIGSDITLNLGEKEVDGQILKTSFTIDLNRVLKNIYDFGTISNEDSIVEHKDVKVYLNWPLLKFEEYCIKEHSINDLLSTTYEFIEKIVYNKKTINVQLFDEKEKEKIFDKLPAALRNKIQLKVLTILRSISQKNIFEIEGFEGVGLNFYNKSHIVMLRLLFQFNLKEIYYEYYVLASRKIDLSYVDSISISERKVFCSLVEQEINSKKQNSQSLDVPAGSTSVQDLMDEFGG